MNSLNEHFFNRLKSLRSFFYHNIVSNPKSEKNVIKSFHKLYYNSAIFDKKWGDTRWFGIPTYKCPLDCWIYQEILFKQKPDFIIECGTASGGSALFLAHLCDSLNKGEILTIDIEPARGKPRHKRIKYLVGSSTSKQILEKLKKLTDSKKNILVILDSDHSYENVIKELSSYNHFIPKGGYLIVEDTNINGHPVRPESGPGPMEAVEKFLKENKNFVIDKSKEKFYLTFNPNGYLRKIR